MFPSREQVAKIKAKYPVGTKVQLLQMDDPQAPPVGTKGVVQGVDDIGSVIVEWETGSRLNLVFGEDEFKVLGKENFYLEYQNGTVKECDTYKEAWEEICSHLEWDDIVWVDMKDHDDYTFKISIRKGIS